MSVNTTNASAEQRLKELAIRLPRPSTPPGTYRDAVQAGNLLFLSGTLPVEEGVPKFLGRIGGELSVEDGRRATRLAALNALAAAREHLGSLERVTRMVRLTVSLATTSASTRASRIQRQSPLATVFGADRTSTRVVYGAASLPVGVCVVVELILEVSM